MSSQRNNYIVRTLLIIGVIILINVVSNFFNVFVDLTEDKRFTLSDSTISFIEDVDDIIYVRVLLEGDFPAGFKRLRAATLDRLDQFADVNPRLEYRFENPMGGSVEEIKARQEQFKAMGMAPQSLTIADGDQTTRKLIYPYALINYGSRQTVVNLLEPQGGMDQETALNNSINLLEFKIANAIQKLTNEDLPNIVISTGHGEVPDYQTAKLEMDLKSYFDTGRLNLDSLYQLSPDDVDLLIVPAPQTAIPVKTQFVIDQYLMNGGKVIWMIENFKVNLDSLAFNKLYVPEPVDHGLDDMLFKYGVRVSKSLLMDLQCSRIPQVIGASGGKAQTQLFPWYYHILSASKSDHPIVKGIDRVEFKFPSKIELLGREDDGIKRQVLMSSSEYSRVQIYPMRLTFEILRIDPDEKQFSKEPQPIAVLLEGEFESFFKNRVTAENEKVLREIGTSFREKSVATKQIVISDADFMKNDYDPKSDRISPIAYNEWEQKAFPGNKSFIVNAVEYMCDDFGLLEARSKDFKLRLLDKVKTRTEKTKWQSINLVLPLAVLWLFAFLFYYWRKKKYASQ